MSGGTVSDCSIGITGVGTKPTLATGAMEAMLGQGADGVAAAAERALEGVTVLEDLYGSEAYKGHLAKVYTRRALEQAISAAS